MEFDMKAVVLTTYGDPANSLECRELPELERPGRTQALIGVEYAPVNFSDVLVAKGLYELRPALPSVIGNEGIGHVLEIGGQVSNVKVGDRVALPIGSFTWRERMLVESERLIVLPGGADPQQLSMVSINPPTACLLLESFVDLEQGDWIAINAANSAIARWLIGFARRKKVKTIGLVRRAEVIDEVLDAGCDQVLLDDEDAPLGASRTIERSRIRLALDGVSGAASGRLARLLGDRGTFVSYAAPTYSPLTISPFDVIFHDLTVKGFSIGNPKFGNRIVTAIEESASMIAEHEVTVPVAGMYPLEEIGAAIGHYERGGKILLKMEGSS
jgi:NADPH:quinone reductase-like Zn-dependent oxidoreductase